MIKQGTLTRNIIIVLFVAVITLFIIDASKIDIEPIWASPSTELTTGWTLQVDGKLLDDDFPVPSVKAFEDVEGKVIVISTVLPDVGGEANNLLFRTSQKTVRVLLDGQTIYTYDAALATRRNKVPGYINHFVWLPDKFAGKLLEIETVSYSARTGGTFYPVLLGSRISAVMDLVRYDGLSVFFGILILITSVEIFVLALTLFRNLAVRKSALMFAGIEFCAGLWMTGGSMSAQLIVHNQVLLFVGGIVAMYLLPVFLTGFVVEMYRIPESVLLSRVVGIFPIMCIFISILQLMGVTTHYKFFTPFAIMLFVYLILLIGFCLKAFLNGNRDIKQFLIAIACLIAAVLGELVLLLLPYHTFFNALFFNVGILAFGLVLLRQVLHHIMVYIGQRAKHEFLLAQANTDGLTGVANRRLFEEKLSELRNKPFKDPVGLMIFDVNDLKLLNDEQGHVAGDELLRQIAKDLVHGFKSVGTVYRIGGDEFAMICSPCDCERYTGIRDRVFGGEAATAASLKNLAYGEALWIHRRDYSSVDDLFRVADERMYSKKQEMKRGKIR